MNDNLKKLMNAITVIPHDQYLAALEKGEVLVCAPVAYGPSGFEDSPIIKCGLCDQDCWIRPYNVPVVKNVMCVPCWIKTMKGGAA